MMAFSVHRFFCTLFNNAFVKAFEIMSLLPLLLACLVSKGTAALSECFVKTMLKALVQKKTETGLKSMLLKREHDYITLYVSCTKLFDLYILSAVKLCL